MKFTTTTALLASAMGVNAAPLSPLDVWDPTITSPVTGTVWVIGTEVNVTWSTDDIPPDGLSNGGHVYLAKEEVEVVSLGPTFDFVAANGSFTVTVPAVVPDDDYQIVLFGDSGNIGPSFTIVASSS
ncbi:hypothetical protein EV368DRAFT_65155 [Lentinula lateritia]|uniref:Uncharacterized protein n=1 Tax=Lentinula aff. lateritia TaxID=2804960 RepID=A0ACC1TIV7_9AGAR|nr:hypothetical protein F5876DRAFT_70471 [Lentinula aff. lateritia]KAJ3852147.1 hypothetical protein EV368DRAFT_65155 [Lentinula lateritia]